MPDCSQGKMNSNVGQNNQELQRPNQVIHINLINNANARPALRQNPPPDRNGHVNENIPYLNGRDPPPNLREGPRNVIVRHLERPAINELIRHANNQINAQRPGQNVARGINRIRPRISRGPVDLVRRAAEINEYMPALYDFLPGFNRRYPDLAGNPNQHQAVFRPDLQRVPNRQEPQAVGAIDNAPAAVNINGAPVAGDINLPIADMNISDEDDNGDDDDMNVDLAGDNMNVAPAAEALNSGSGARVLNVANIQNIDIAPAAPTNNSVPGPLVFNILRDRNIADDVPAGGRFNLNPDFPLFVPEAANANNAPLGREMGPVARAVNNVLDFDLNFMPRYNYEINADRYVNDGIGRGWDDADNEHDFDYNMQAQLAPFHLDIDDGEDDFINIERRYHQMGNRRGLRGGRGSSIARNMFNERILRDSTPSFVRGSLLIIGPNELQGMPSSRGQSNGREPRRGLSLFRGFQATRGLPNSRGGRISRGAASRGALPPSVYVPRTQQSSSIYVAPLNIFSGDESTSRDRYRAGASSARGGHTAGYAARPASLWPLNPPNGLAPGRRGPLTPPNGLAPGRRGPLTPPNGLAPGRRGPLTPPNGRASSNGIFADIDNQMFNGNFVPHRVTTVVARGTQTPSRMRTAVNNAGPRAIPPTWYEQLSSAATAAFRRSFPNGIRAPGGPRAARGARYPPIGRHQQMPDRGRSSVLAGGSLGYRCNLERHRLCVGCNATERRIQHLHQKILNYDREVRDRARRLRTSSELGRVVANVIAMTEAEGPDWWARQCRRPARPAASPSPAPRYEMPAPPEYPSGLNEGNASRMDSEDDGMGYAHQQLDDLYDLDSFEAHLNSMPDELDEALRSFQTPDNSDDDSD